jgi:hypothetical protein
LEANKAKLEANKANKAKLKALEDKKKAAIGLLNRNVPRDAIRDSLGVTEAWLKATERQLKGNIRKRRA